MSLHCWQCAKSRCTTKNVLPMWNTVPFVPWCFPPQEPLEHCDHFLKRLASFLTSENPSCYSSTELVVDPVSHLFHPHQEQHHVYARLKVEATRLFFVSSPFRHLCTKALFVLVFVPFLPRRFPIYCTHYFEHHRVENRVENVLMKSTSTCCLSVLGFGSTYFYLSLKQTRQACS